jgi:hypothetical protein
MAVSLSRLLAAAGLAAFCAQSGAHESGEAQRPPIYMDCEHVPEAAVSVLPDPVEAWTALDCRPLGQLLVQKEGWVWRYPGSWTEQVLLPAWIASASNGNAGTGARYFKSMAVEKREGAAAEALLTRFAREVVSYQFLAQRADQAAPAVVYTLVAQNDLGDELHVNFLYRSDADIWAVTCAPECRPENVFKVYRRQ